MDINPDDLPFVIYACFVLHNFCEMSKESINDDKVQRAIDYDRDFQPLPVAKITFPIVMRQKSEKGPE